MILITNDDGIVAKGLLTLRDRLAVDYDVIVVAPDGEQSASGHAVTLHRPLRITQIDERNYATDGTPTDCVLLAVHGILNKKPNLIISGINAGPNLGDDVTYSGTVAAAMEGTLLGIPSIAISLATWKEASFSIAADYAAKIVNKVLKNGLPSHTLINVNVPNLAKKDIKGIKITKLGRRIYKDTIKKNFDPRGRPYYWIAGEPVWLDKEECDLSAIEEGYVSISPVHLDMTDYKNLKYIEEIMK